MSELVMTRAKEAATELRPQRLHHTARVVKDQEITRRFYEDVIGMPLMATWTEVGEFPDVPGETVSFCHTFFGLADGGAVAFFQFAKPEVHEIFKAKTQTGFNHLALAVSRKAQDQIQARLEAAGYEVRMIDHGYCRSIYTRDPDALNLEFTSDLADAPQIADRQAKTAHSTLKRWLAGDLTPNNDLQPS
jgi:catechol 2,3-dioxygenase-like lactoylglutathione lyase family enzyme